MLINHTYSCMLDESVGPDGPFATAQWSVYVIKEDLQEMQEWVMQNRMKHSILVHTNTGCLIKDHTDYSFWAGQPHVLDLDFFGTSDASHPNLFNYKQSPSFMQ